MHHKSIIYIINQKDATLAVLCLLTTAITLYMFRTLSASIIRSTRNCSNRHCACHESGWCIFSEDVRGSSPNSAMK